MTQAQEPAPPEVNLADLRQEIDGIDRALHTLLIERGEIIDRLIAVKARQGGGSAFRPAREAEMMRRLVTRHRGILPLDTVESIWRIIISTFTYVQAPYSVHADVSAGDAPMRDACRFHFGFTVPLVPAEGADEVISTVAKARGDLGLVRVDDARTPWWRALAVGDAPKIIARLPFVERADHAADLPLYVIAKPLEEATLHDVMLYAVEDAEPVQVPGVEVIGRADGSLLIAAPEKIGEITLKKAFGTDKISYIGSHAARFEIAAQR